MIDRRLAYKEYCVDDRCLIQLKKNHIEKIRLWRNAQITVLRQKKSVLPEEQKRWYANMLMDKNQVLFALLKIAPSGRAPLLIGYCGLVHINWIKKRGEISFIVNPFRAERHNLYKQDFLSGLWLLSKYAFEKQRLKEIFTETYSFRKRHIRILEEFGMKYKRKAIKSYYCNSKYYDSYFHKLNSKDWKKIKNIRY